MNYQFNSKERESPYCFAISAKRYALFNIAASRYSASTPALLKWLDKKVFDRITGKSVEPTQLKTYAEVLCQYHLSSENKFENGQFLDRGRTEWRHVIAAEFVLIGKEANMVGESGEADPIESAMEEFKGHGSSDI